MDNIIDFLRPHVDRIYQAGLEQGRMLAGDRSQVPEVDELPVDGGTGEPDDGNASLLAKHLPAIRDAMLRHAHECAKGDVDMVPGLDALVGLLDRPHRIGRVIKGDYRPRVTKAYRAEFSKAELSRQIGVPWESTTRPGMWFVKRQEGGRTRVVRTRNPSKVADEAQRAHSHARVREITSRLASRDATPDDLRQLAEHLPNLTARQLGTARELMSIQHSDATAKNVFGGKRGHLDRVKLLAEYARAAAQDMEGHGGDSPAMAGEFEAGKSGNWMPGGSTRREPVDVGELDTHPHGLQKPLADYTDAELQKELGKRFAALSPDAVRSAGFDPAAFRVSKSGVLQRYIGRKRGEQQWMTYSTTDSTGELQRLLKLTGMPPQMDIVTRHPLPEPERDVEPHELTLTDYLQSGNDPELMQEGGPAIHRESVASAIAAGKHVRPEVLEDYPELKAGYMDPEHDAMERMNAHDVGTDEYEQAKTDYLHARQAKKAGTPVDPNANSESANLPKPGVQVNKPTKAFPHPKWVKGEPEIKGTLDAYDRATGKEKEFIQNAMENAGILRFDARGERVTGYEKELPEDARERLAQGLAAAFRDAHPLGQTDHITAALKQLGAEQVGGEGEPTSFDGAVHDHIPGAFTGHDVTTTRPGWLMPNGHGNGADKVLLKAKVGKGKVGEEGTPDTAEGTPDIATPSSTGPLPISGNRRLLDLSPNELHPIWEHNRDAISRSDRKMSPAQAGSLAAARILNARRDAAADYRDEIDQRVRDGQDIHPADDERYIRLGNERGEHRDALVGVSGYRPSGDADNHPMAKQPVSFPGDAEPELRDRLKAATAHIDPESTRQIRQDRQETYASLTAALEGAQKHLDNLEAQKRVVGNKQPEKRNLDRDILQADKLVRERQEKRDAYLNDDSHRRAEHEHIALDESQPEFVRYAAARALNPSVNPDETYDHIRGSVREHLSANGHDPEIADAVAAEVAHKPRYGATHLHEIIRGEATRKQMQREREEARSHIASLGLEGGHKDNAEREANGLYAGDLEGFKRRWSGIAEGHAAEKSRRLESNRIAQERAEKEAAAGRKADDYLKSVHAGHPETDVDAATMHEVALRTLAKTHDWHEGVELPGGRNAKQQVDAAAKALPGSRFALPKTVTEQGWLTDTKYMVKATPEMVEYAKKQGHDQLDGRTPPTNDIIDAAVKKRPDPAELVASKPGRVLAETETGQQAALDADYVANILKLYPGAKPFVAREGNGAVVFKKDGEVVGLVMPFGSGDANEAKVEYAKGDRLSLGDALAPGPYTPEDVEEIGQSLRAGHGDPGMELRIGGKSGAYTLPDYTDQEYPTWSQAVEAGKDILAHAHGVDEDGKLVFRPKGSEPTELPPDEKTRRDFHADLRERVRKTNTRVTPKKMTFVGGDQKEVTRDVLPVAEHFGVMKELPDDKGKVGSGHRVVHLPSGLLLPTTWTSRGAAVGHAHVVQGIPGADWGSVTQESGESEPERMKELGKRVQGVTNAYEKNELHPDMIPQGGNGILAGKSAATPHRNAEPPSTTPEESRPGSAQADPTVEPTTPSALVEDAASQAGKSPREVADAVGKANEGYEFARASAVGNIGEDLKGSARHRANAWRGLDDAEKNGTAEKMVRRDNLLKAEPLTLMATVTPHTALSHLAAHLAMNAFPGEPGDYPRAYEKYRSRGGVTPLPRKTPEELRKQYLDAYRAIKGVVEKTAAEKTDPRDVLRAVTVEAKRQINIARGLPPEASGLIASAGAPDPYNPVANALIDMHNRAAGSGAKTTHVMSRIGDFVKRVKAAYPATTPETLGKVADHVKDVMEGDSFNKTFGTQGEKANYFDPASAYVKHAERKGGRVVDASTVESGSKYVADNLKMRGLQWGNYVTDDERQHHLTKTAEALADLADVTGLPDHAMSLGGKLGLAIGARGTGRALAHYEPGTKVINLTRAGGVGSLAHEWGHALDHEIGGGNLIERGGKKVADYLSTNPRAKDAGPVGEAMTAIRKAFHDSGFDDRLRVVLSDMAKKGLLPSSGTAGQTAREYWTSSQEKFARAFEKYVQHKLQASGRDNTYLSGSADHELWPTPEETAQIAPLMDVLMAAVKDKHYPSASVGMQKAYLPAVDKSASSPVVQAPVASKDAVYAEMKSYLASVIGGNAY